MTLLKLGHIFIFPQVKLFDYIIVDYVILINAEYLGTIERYPIDHLVKMNAASEGTFFEDKLKAWGNLLMKRFVTSVEISDVIKFLCGIVL